MIPRRSWATMVHEAVYRKLKDAPDCEQTEIPVIEWIGDTPETGDAIYLIKPKTEDDYTHPGIFCSGTLMKFSGGLANLRLSKRAVLTRKDSSYFRFNSLNLKDKFLRKTSLVCTKLGSAHFLDDSTSVRLETLACKTDIPFSALDAKISLLAYEESFILGITPESSHLVPIAAIDCGRLVTSISSKMSNFKSLDKERSKGGRPNGAKIDKITWEEYYDSETKKIDVARLRQDIAIDSKDYEYAFVIEEEKEPAGVLEIPNDEDSRQAYARRVRKGQSRFRMALHKLYGSRCAFTSTDEESVLEACHIISHAKTGDNSLDNGLLLRSDIHVLFDEHLMTLANDGQRILVHNDVTAPEYAKLRGKTTGLRPSTSARHLELLQQHNSELIWAV